MTYYRGSKVSLRGGELRLSIPEPRSFRTAKAGSAKAKAVFWKGFFARGKKAESREELKTYAFYRPGVTPAEDTPVFSERKRAWIFKAPALNGAKWAFRLAGLVLLLGAVVWSKSKTTVLLQDMAGLTLSKVGVEGNHYLTEDEILKTAALPLGVNMFKLDLAGVTEKIKGMDWVERVFIERRLPSAVLISVKERTPVALLDEGTLYGVDGEGRVLSPSDALMKEDLPLISGMAFGADAVGTTRMASALKPALDFLAFVKRQDRVLSQDVSEVNLSEPDALKVTFIDGIQALFAPPVSETELRRMALVLSDLSGKGKRAGTLDFRFRDMVVVKTRVP